MILTTDIVGSTEKAIELGDLEWRELLETHHAIVRKHARDQGGRVLKAAGDGFVIGFGDRIRAERCAQVIEDDVVRLGIRVRTRVDES